MENKSNFKEFLCSDSGKTVLTVAMYILCWGLMALMGSLADTVAPFFTVPAFLIFGVWIYMGWKSLNKIQPDVFLIMPIAGWILFIVIKGMLSIVVGIFVAPYYISKKIVESIQKKMN